MKGHWKIGKACLILQKNLMDPHIFVPVRGDFSGKEFNAFLELANVEKKPLKLLHNSK
jgi:hypothetical protein